MEFLVLEVDGAQFGIPTSDVREVVRAASLGAAPARFPNMAGMLNYRGQVLGVLELACLRGAAPRDLMPHDHLIILQITQRLFGLRVDQAVEIMEWADRDQPPPAEASTDERLRAIAHPRLGVVYLLDTAQLWSELHLEQSRQPTQEVEAN